MDFRVLGPLEVVGDDGTLVTPGAFRQRRLLAALLLDPRRAVSIDRLVEIVWDGATLPEAPVPALRTYVTRLRATLDGGAAAPDEPRIVAGPSGYLLRVADDDIDAFRFVHLIDKARARLSADDAEGAVAVTDAALSLWRGAAYGEFADDEWFRPEAVRLEELRLEVLELRNEALLVAGRNSEVAAECERLTLRHPLREAPHRQLVTALARLERQADAMAAARAYRGVLAEETGLDPSAEFRRVEDEVARGGQRAEDAGASAAPAAPAAVTTAPSNLATPRTTFVGRASDITAVGRRLETGRLVTLTGIGGAGKTRLAIEVGHALRDRFADGVFIAELASLPDAALVARRIGDAVGLPATGGGGAATSDSIENALVDYLSGRQLLLILDNCEHLLDACRRVVDHLLDAGPTLRVLATSRQDLGVDGEQIWPVGPLSLPGGTDDSLGEALQLLVDRAEAVQPGFAVDAENRAALIEICRRLDGIPLALELVAGRLSHLSPREVADRIGDRFGLLVGGRARPSRQQTLRSAIDWSHNLLDDNEAVLFRRLAVFGGGATLRAIEEVCGGDLRGSVIDLVRSLVAKSLVVADTRHGQARYRMLETVRVYALDKLEQAGESGQLRARHRWWLTTWFESYPWDLRLASPAVTAVLESERDNLRHALEWSQTDTSDPDAAARLLMAASGLFITFGDLSEGRRWHASLGAALEGLEDEPRHRLAIHSALIECWRSGGGSMPLFEQLIEEVPGVMAALPPDCEEMAIGHAVMAVVHAIVTHDPDLMVRHGRRGAELALRMGAPQFAGFAKTLAAGGHLYRGDAPAAVAELEPMVTEPGWSEEHDGLRVRAHLAIARHLAGDHTGALADASIAVPRLNLAWRHDPLLAQALAHAALGEVDAAESCMHQALTLLNELRWNEPIIRHDMLIGFGGIAALRGDHRRASTVLAPVRWTTNPSAFGVYLHYRNVVREHLDDGVRRQCIAEGRARGVDDMLQQEAAAIGMSVAMASSRRG